MVSEEPAAARPRVRRTSEVLREAVLAEPGERISVEQLDRALGRRAYGALMLLFALPNLVPVMPPGVSSVLSLPLLLLSVQLAAGRVAPVCICCHRFQAVSPGKRTMSIAVITLSV